MNPRKTLPSNLRQIFIDDDRCSRLLKKKTLLPVYLPQQQDEMVKIRENEYCTFYVEHNNLKKLCIRNLESQPPMIKEFLSTIVNFLADNVSIDWNACLEKINIEKWFPKFDDSIIVDTKGNLDQMPDGDQFSIETVKEIILKNAILAGYIAVYNKPLKTFTNALRVQPIRFTARNITLGRYVRLLLNAGEVIFEI